MDRRQEISNATAFDTGELFDSPADVYRYFTVEAQRDMFGDDAIDDQDVLDQMAEEVIANRWHCAFEEDIEAVAEVIRSVVGDIVYGSEDPVEVARRWVALGFNDPEDVRAWLSAPPH